MLLPLVLLVVAVLLLLPCLLPLLVLVLVPWSVTSGLSPRGRRLAAAAAAKRVGPFVVPDGFRGLENERSSVRSQNNQSIHAFKRTCIAPFSVFGPG